MLNVSWVCARDEIMQTVDTADGFFAGMSNVRKMVFFGFSHQYHLSFISLSLFLWPSLAFSLSILPMKTGEKCLLKEMEETRCERSIQVVLNGIKYPSHLKYLLSLRLITSPVR